VTLEGQGQRAQSGHRGPDRVLEVLDFVDAIPPGHVMSYGDVARHVGLASPRQVGQIMARHGHAVPWHRIVMADGSPAPHQPREQLARLRSEHVPLVGGRVDMTRARWQAVDTTEAPAHAAGRLAPAAARPQGG